MRDESRTAALGQCLRRARLQQGLSQMELAYSVGMVPSQISLLEHGHSLPTLFGVLRLLGALGLSVEVLCVAMEGEHESY